MSIAPSASDMDVVLFERFLAGDKDSRNEFPLKYHRFLVREAANATPDLPRDLREDVAQEAWLLLLSQKSPTFDPSQGSVKVYLRGVLRDAARRVRANFTPPGEQTRLHRGEDGNLVSQQTALSLDAAIGLQDDQPMTLGDCVQDPENYCERALDRIHAEQILCLAAQTAPPPVHTALRVIYDQDLGFSSAAERVGVSRMWLRRRLTTWAKEQEDALAA